MNDPNASMLFVNAKLVLPDRILPTASVLIKSGLIVQVFSDCDSARKSNIAQSWSTIDLAGNYLMPGFVDLHIHGGAGHDFMDGTEEAFNAIAACHAKHGTTSMTPTSTVANWDDYLTFLGLAKRTRDRSIIRKGDESSGSVNERNRADDNRKKNRARLLGGHLYGPYFHRPAKGCHPDADFLLPNRAQYEQLLAFAGDGMCTLTVAPETVGTIDLIEAAKSRNLLITAGHSYATFEQMEKAMQAGVQHIDHLFCAMSDRARLRSGQPFPMQGGVLEATLHFDELTTEVIADGQHLAPSLLRLAYKVKGPDRLCLVTDSMRAVDMPDGPYWFGPNHRGEQIQRLGTVGLTLDGKGLASSVMGMDHMIRVFHESTHAPLNEVIRMASLTPAKILGVDAYLGSIEEGKIADLVVMTSELEVKSVYIGGELVK